MGDVCQIKDTSSTPGADSNTYNLFNSVTSGIGGRLMAAAGYKRFLLNIKCNHDGTLKAYKSSDRGTTWNEVQEDSVTAPASTTSLDYDYLIEGFADFKLDWVNGGTAQTTWALSMALTTERALAG